MFLKMDTWAKYVWCLLDTLLRGNLNSAILFDTYRKYLFVLPQKWTTKNVYTPAMCP